MRRWQGAGQLGVGYWLGEQQLMSLGERLAQTGKLPVREEVGKGIVSRRNTDGVESEVVGETKPKDLPEDALGQRIPRAAGAQAVLHVFVVDVDDHSGWRGPVW